MRFRPKTKSVSKGKKRIFKKKVEEKKMRFPRCGANQKGDGRTR